MYLYPYTRSTAMCTYTGYVVDGMWFHVIPGFVSVSVELALIVSEELWFM